MLRTVALNAGGRHRIADPVMQYGENIDWERKNFTMYDVAGVLRRYLTMLPEPVIPDNLHTKVRL